MGVIDEVKEKTDILEVVGQYVVLTKAGRIFRGLCPFHSEKHGSFFVYPEQQSWHCFGACGTGGDVFSFIMKKENMDFGEALRFLARKAGITLPVRAEAETRGKENEKLYQINQEAAHFFHEQLISSHLAERARAYVSRRGLSSKTVTDFTLGFSLPAWDGLKSHLTGMGYAESDLIRVGLLVAGENGRVHDRFRGKLMFPILDAGGHVTGFGARVLDDSQPKYLNSPETPVFSKSGNLYGINLAAASIRQKDMAVITEGYMDVITAHQNDFTNVVAAMGTAVSDRQAGMIKRLTRNAALALDADAAGEEAMLRCAALENIIEYEVKVVRMPAGKDPDDVIREDPETWQRLLDGAEPLMDYILNMITGRLDLSRAKDKTLAADRLLPVIADMKDTVRQAHYLQKLAGLIKVNEKQLETALSKKKTSRITGPSQPARTETMSRTSHPLFAKPLEEYCLALLLKHPELKEMSRELRAEYFENSENREIYHVWRQGEESNFRDELAPEIQEHLESLMAREILDIRVEEKFTRCFLRLQESYLRNREKGKEALLATEAESNGPAAELTKLGEQGIEESQELKRIFVERARHGVEPRR
ncbi:MAG: DNA primase [Chloroflexota bacterium]